MTRPLMQYGVGQLQELFAKGKADATLLKQLENELQYRQVPRAVALLAEVQVAMRGASPPARPHPTPEPSFFRPPAPQQPSLWDRPIAPPHAAMSKPTVPPRAATHRRPTDTLAASKATLPPAPNMPLEDAYKLLKTTAGSTWESIEETRRRLVQQSHPVRLKSMSADRRVQAISEATLVNAAYSALFRARCGEF